MGQELVVILGAGAGPAVDGGLGALRGGGGATCGGEQRRVGRSIGDVGRLERSELLAQHRHHLFAEDVELLQHHLLRQTGVVHEEQLALVVPDVLAETGALRSDDSAAAN